MRSFLRRFAWAFSLPLIFGALVPSIEPHANAEEYWANVFKGSTSRMRVRMQNVDDLGMLILIDPQGNSSVVASAEWNMDNQGGFSEVDLTDTIHEGTWSLVFVLHNKEWALGPYSKASVDFVIWGDDYATLVNHSILYHDRPKGIQAWMSFLITRSGDRFFVEIGGSDLARALAPMVEALNDELVEKFGHESSVSAYLGQALADSLLRYSEGAGSGTGALGGYDPNEHERVCQAGGCGPAH